MMPTPGRQLELTHRQAAAPPGIVQKSPRVFAARFPAQKGPRFGATFSTATLHNYTSIPCAENNIEVDFPPSRRSSLASLEDANQLIQVFP